jgi:hypothetical protein
MKDYENAMQFLISTRQRSVDRVILAYYRCEKQEIKNPEKCNRVFPRVEIFASFYISHYFAKNTAILTFV